MKRENIGELPSDEAQWEVPEPVRPEPDNDRGTQHTHTHTGMDGVTMSRITLTAPSAVRYMLVN